MRVAIVCFGTTGRGGMETVIATVLRQFRLDGDAPRLFLLGGSQDSGWFGDLPVTVIGAVTDSKILRYAKYVLQLPAAMKAFAPEAILCADPRAVFIAYLVKKLLRLPAPVASWMHFTLDRLAKTKYLGYADLHLAISNGVLNDLRARGFGAAHLVYNPIVPVEKMHPRSRIPTFLCLGRVTLGGQKRTDDFLRALAGLSGSFRAEVVGGGPDETRLKALAGELGIAGLVNWHGWQRKPWEVAPAATALVMTSEYEGFAMALAESITRGLPGISTDCHAGPADIIVPSKNGWLVPVGDIGALTKTMQSIVNGSEALPSPDEVAGTSRKFLSASVTEAMRHAFSFHMQPRSG